MLDYVTFILLCFRKEVGAFQAALCFGLNSGLRCSNTSIDIQEEQKVSMHNQIIFTILLGHAELELCGAERNHRAMGLLHQQGAQQWKDLPERSIPSAKGYYRIVWQEVTKVRYSVNISSTGSTGKATRPRSSMRS